MGFGIMQLSLESVPFEIIRCTAVWAVRAVRALEKIVLRWS